MITVQARWEAFYRAENMEIQIPYSWGSRTMETE